MKSPKDVYLRWLGPIVLFLFGNLFFRLAFWLEAPTLARLQSALVGVSAGYLFWELNRGAIQRTQERLPGLQRTTKRVGLWLLLTPILVNAAVFSRFAMHMLLGSRPDWWLGLVDYVTSFGIQLFYHVVYFAIYEGWYIVRQSTLR